jgi:hypothetical protein
VDLPACYVLVGVGARVGDGKVKTLDLWGAKLKADGTLGVAVQFQGGIEPTGTLEQVYQAPAGRTQTGVGFRVTNNGVSGLRAVTDAWVVQ